MIKTIRNMRSRNRHSTRIQHIVRFSKDRKSYIFEAMNPLQNLSVKQAQAIFDMARRGCYAQLHYIYAEMERVDPTLYTCVERRAAALSELEWKVVRSDVRRHRMQDDGLIQAQIEYLETAIADCGNLPEAMEHLALAFFRGFAAVQPIYSDNSTLRSLQLIDSWNLCWDRERQLWQWNPEARIGEPGISSGYEDIPHSEIVTIRRRQYVDYPAMAIYIRTALGEKDWGRFIERYGVPPATIIMPEFTDPALQDKFLQAAQDVADAGNGALPYGSQVSYATEARGTDPFTAFLDHQQKLVVLMATGGLATSLETAQGLGSGTSDAHLQTWRTIVRRDARVFANAINRQICERLLAAEFPGKPTLAEFALETESPPTSAEVFEDAGAARQAGYTIVQEDIEQLTGYRLERYEPVAAIGSPGDMWQGLHSATGVMPHRIVASPLQNRLGAETARTDARAAATPQIAPESILADLAKSLSADLRPVADKIIRLLELPVSERTAAAAALLDELPTLTADDPQMAAILSETLAEVFADQLDKGYET